MAGSMHDNRPCDSDSGSVDLDRGDQFYLVKN